MALFEFELANVADIEPWESADGPSLSWFALTDGLFQMRVGDQVLFEYSDEILAYWASKCGEGRSEPRRNLAGYQIAAFARDILGSVAAGTGLLPERIERLASNWTVLNELRQRTCEVEDSEGGDDLGYSAWRWVSERSPWTSYLVASPQFQFIRIGEELRVHWDNRDRVVDGICVWTAGQGMIAMPVGELVLECRSLAERLLSDMERRIVAIERAVVQPRAVVNVASLREQHESWRRELDSYFGEYQPDIEWGEAERAIEVIANRRGVRF